MSWSISFIGKAEKISKALKKHSTKLEGKSKEEYDAALPHIEALVSQNVNPDYPPVLRVDASGHGYDKHNSVNVSIAYLGSEMV